MKGNVARQIYTANEIVYTVAMDDPTPPGLRPRALVRATLVDEMSGVPPRSPIDLQTAQPGLFARVADDGLVGWAGVPNVSLSQLRTKNYDFQVQVKAQRYVPLSLPVHFPMDATFPATFTAVDLGTLQLHRLPVIVSGRVRNLRVSPPVPVGNVDVLMRGLWRTPPPAWLNVPPAVVNVVSLQPALYFGRTGGASTLTTVTLQPTLGQDKQLISDAADRSSLVSLSDSIGLNPGDHLAIDYQDPQKTEYLTIQSLAGIVPANQPRNVTLTYPLQMLHRRGAPTRRFTPINPGVATPFSIDTIAGDTCVFLQTMANLPPALPPPVPPQAVLITGAPATDEFHVVSQFATRTDANGFFQLPSLSRVAQFTLRAHDGALGNLDRTIAPDYASAQFGVQFVYE